MFKIFNANGQHTEYLCDYISDISTLPTANRKGKISYGGDDLKVQCAAGSMAYCLENSSLYTLGIETDEWHLQQQSGEIKINLSEYAKLSDIPEWALNDNKPTYTAEEVGAMPIKTKLPEKISDLENDSNFLTEETQSDWNENDESASSFIKNKPTSLPASDVKSWAKQETKPTYTASEVGALPSDTKINDLQIDDDVNGKSYSIGVESGLIYLQEK